jgi:tetratricopeptide (TPR) repeat protein
MRVTPTVGLERERLLRVIPLSDRVLGRATRVMLAIAVLSTVALVLYGLRDHFFTSGESLARHETERLEKVISEEPDNLQARISLGNAYIADGRYQDAIDQLNQALELATDSEQRGVFTGLALAYMGAGDKAQAADYFGKVVEISEAGGGVARDRVLETAYYYLGKLALEDSRADEAVDFLKKAVGVEGSDSDALYLLGRAFEAQGDYESAVEAYKVALGFVPNYREAYEGLARVYEAQGQPERAKYARAMITLFTGDPAAAAASLQAVAASVTDDPDLFWGLGLAYERSGQQDKAVEAYRQAVSLRDDHFLARDALQRLGGEPQEEGQP